MVIDSRMRFVYVVALLAWGLWPAASLFAQARSYLPPGQPVIHDIDSNNSYVVGPRDVLAIAFPGEPRLTGKFTVETDRTFTYPYVGRVQAGGMTLREVEAELRRQLLDGGFYKDPQLIVTVEQYRSRNVFVVGEVRTPGTYSLSGTMRLAETLALAGWMLPTASGEAVIVPAGSEAMEILSSTEIERRWPKAEDPNATRVTRVNLRELEMGDHPENVALSDGDTVFVLRGDNIYLVGQVKNPDTYIMRQGTTVSQALALGGGITRRAATSRIQIVRMVNGERKKMKVDLGAALLPGDAIVVPERHF